MFPMVMETRTCFNFENAHIISDFIVKLATWNIFYKIVSWKN